MVKTAQKTIQDSYLAVGAMSGTSADGLDLALCRYIKVSGKRPDDGDNAAGKFYWTFKILKTRTLSYSGTSWPERLNRAEKADGYALAELHMDFGKFTGDAVKDFLAEMHADLIASHGHTIFHRPEKGITLQIGDGAEIAARTGITTVSDFRRLDVALGGQGAPLVPVGDDLLFGHYTFCLNLGGFANISFRESGKRVAFDICPVNIVLNRLARSIGNEYDKGGRITLSGKVIPELLRELESIEYYRKTGPRSLGREWVEEVFIPVLDKYDKPVPDKLRTVSEHIALRIAAVMHKNINQNPPAKAFENNPVSTSVLATGGGANNKFLMQLISEKASPARVIIPEREIIDFKEAIVFGFLGVLRLRNEINCLASVTGSRKNNSGGIIHQG